MFLSLYNFGLLCSADGLMFVCYAKEGGGAGEVYVCRKDPGYKYSNTYLVSSYAAAATATAAVIVCS